MWSGLLGGIGLIVNLYQQQQAKRAAEQAARQQRMSEAATNMARILGGGMPQAMSPVQAIPGVDVAGVIGGLGGLAGDYEKQTKQAEQEKQNQQRWDAKMGLETQKVNQGWQEIWDRRFQNDRSFNADTDPNAPKNKQLMAETVLTNARISKLRNDLETGGSGQYAGTPLTQNQVIDKFIDSQKGKWIEDPATGKQIFVPAGSYSLPDPAQFALEDAVGIQPKYGNVSDEPTTGLPDWMKPKKRVPATSYFKSETGGGNNRLGLNVGL